MTIDDRNIVPVDFESIHLFSQSRSVVVPANIYDRQIVVCIQVQYVALRKQQKRPGSRFFNELG